MTIGVLGIVVAVAAVYGISNMNSQIQAKPGQIIVPDYSAQLDSLKSQVDTMNSKIDSISNKLATLDTLKNNVADIQGKLSDIENKSI